MANSRQWAWFDAGERHERERIIALLKSIDDWSGVDCEYVIKEITN
jgi:hypothetical protein